MGGTSGRAQTFAGTSGSGTPLAPPPSVFGRTGKVRWEGSAILLCFVAGGRETLLERLEPRHLRSALRADRRGERAPGPAAALLDLPPCLRESCRGRLPGLAGVRLEPRPDGWPFGARRNGSRCGGNRCWRRNCRRSRNHRHGRRFGRWLRRAWLRCWLRSGDDTRPGAGRNRRHRARLSGRGALRRIGRGDARNGDGRRQGDGYGHRYGLGRRSWRWGRERGWDSGGRRGGRWRLGLWQQTKCGG